MWERKLYGTGGAWNPVAWFDVPPTVYRWHNTAVKRGRRDALLIPCRAYAYRFTYCV